MIVTMMMFAALSCSILLKINKCKIVFFKVQLLKARKSLFFKLTTAAFVCTWTGGGADFTLFFLNTSQDVHRHNYD